MAETQTSNENDVSNMKNRIQKPKKMKKKVVTLQCNICNKNFRGETNLMFHLRTHPMDKTVYNCAHCDKRFLCKDSLKRHLHTHNLFEKKFPCFYCDKSFHLKNILNFHVVEKHTVEYSPTERFQCMVCSKTFVLESKLQDHLKSHDNVERPKNYICPVCEKPHYKRADMQAHLVTHSTELKFECQVPGCGARIQHKRNFILHMKSHGPREYLCDVCGKCFSLPSKLKEHYLTHLSYEDKKRYECHICGKSYAQSNGLKAHRSLHTNERPHKCSYCGKMFRLRSHLQQHETIHSGEKSFECIVCGKKFLHQRYLRQHSAVHSSKVPFWCANCDKSFHFKCSFKTHLVTCGVEEEKFLCSKCNQHYMDLNLYLEHMCTHKKGWDCVKCDKAFDDFSLLSQHVMSCVAEKNSDDIQVSQNGTQPKHEENESVDMLEELIVSHEVLKADSPKTNAVSRPEKTEKHMEISEKSESDFDEEEIKIEEFENEDESERKEKFPKCLECDTHFQSENELMKHIFVHAMKDGQFYCKTCNQKFRRKISFTNHWKKNHLA